jgi:phage gpG-like protein
VEALGAGQGIAYIGQKAYLYGDREVGIIREYRVEGDSLVYTNKEVRLTQQGKDVINHLTGIAYNESGPTFMGNSIRLNKEGTSWKAVIYALDWTGLLKSGSLDGNLLNVIEDDACIQGTRPEYVKYHGKWYVATADYGSKANEVRLYDPQRLLKAKKTSEKGVLFRKFSCGPWVQNIHWVPQKNMVILIQNQVEGRKWRFTYLDLAKSVATGKQAVIREIDIDKADELEGFALLGNAAKGLAVTSSREDNAHFLDITW